jgi:hypothetical protein
MSQAWRPEPAKVLLRSNAAQQQAGKARLAPPVYLGSVAVQRCTFCGHDTCRDGEVCKADKTYSGMFNVSSTSGNVSKHKHNKRNSKRNVRESEHVLASQAIRKSIVKRHHGGKGKRPIHSTGKNYNQNEEYTISIPYSVHRGGTSGAGGGISSTGSSGTSTGWAEHVGGMLENSPFDAIAAVVNEHLNSYFMQDKLDETVLNNIFRWIDGQVHTGRITAQEAAELKQQALNLAVSLYRLQESIKNFKKGGGPGKGGGGLTGGILVES